MHLFLAIIYYKPLSPTKTCTLLSPQMISWREDALKMVFLITDQNYHIAGDGKV
jgi:hypothetical protein